MFLTRSWFQKRSRWNQLPAELDPLSVPGLLSPTEMENAFRRERARVDRNDQSFSIVVFRVDAKRKDDVRRAAALLIDRVRAYDVLGMVDSERLAALLPETDGRGSWVFADSAMAQLSHEDLRVSCEVYSYPGDADGAVEGSVMGAATASDYRQVPRDRGPAPADGSADAAGGGAAPAGDGPPLTRSTGTDGAAVLAGAVETAPGPRALHRLEPVASALPPEPVGRPAPRPVRDCAQLFVEPLPVTRRILDVAVSGLAILALSPVLLTTAALVKLTSPGPIIFWQWRVGRGGRRFRFYKFRSMVQDAEDRKGSLRIINEKEGPIFKIKDDPRITPVGRVIRRLSIDELPQLFNVLKGDMTLVGPRPPVVDEVEAYEPWQRQRLDITGGLTCIWQVSGRSEVSFDDWMRMDIRYKQTRSWGLDLKLMWKTFGAVFSGRGAY